MRAETTVTNGTGADLLHGLLARAERLTTPSGDGVMVWHAWGEGPALVLLHGGSGSWNHWIRNIDRLAVRYHVLAADIPGLGASDMPPEPYTSQSIARILLAGIDAILGERSDFAVAGFSFGGLLSGPLALIAGGRVRSVTLVGPSGLGLPSGRVEPLLKRRRDMPAAERALLERENLARLMIHDRAKIDDLAVQLQAWNMDRSRTNSRIPARTDVLARALAGVRAPLSGIWGERDALAASDLGARRRLLQSCQPDAVVRVIAGAGHWVQYEAADAFNDALLDSLAAAEERRN